MKDRNKREGRLRRLFSATYMARDPGESQALTEMSGLWRQRVMACIGEIGPLSTKPPFLPAFEQFVWRLAPASLAVSVVLAALLVLYGLNVEPDGLQSLSNYLEELPLRQIFGT